MIVSLPLGLLTSSMLLVLLLLSLLSRALFGRLLLSLQSILLRASPLLSHSCGLLLLSDSIQSGILLFTLRSLASLTQECLLPLLGRRERGARVEAGPLLRISLVIAFNRSCGCSYRLV